MKKRCSIGFLFLFLSVLLISCKKKDKVVVTEIEIFTVEDQVIIGRTMKDQIANMPTVFKILDSATYKEAYGYLATLFQTLKLTAVVKHRNDFSWDFTILQNDDQKTAFSLPGGHIYIYTGLLKFLNSEHELMAVLGNEIAYADKGFVAEALLESYGGKTLGDIKLGTEVSNLSEIVASIPSIEYPMEIVVESDKFGIELLCPFQYDIDGLEKFLQKAHTNQIQWIQSKKGDMQSRLAAIATTAAPCGEDGVTNLEQYQSKIKNFLP